MGIINKNWTLLRPFFNMRVNAAASGFAPHEHGESSYADEQVAFLEQRDSHCDRHHGVVLDADGSEVPPGIIGPIHP